MSLAPFRSPPKYFVLHTYFKFPFSPNDLGQCSHWNGLSFRCTHLWLISIDRKTHDLLNNVHSQHSTCTNSLTSYPCFVATHTVSSGPPVEQTISCKYGTTVSAPKEKARKPTTSQNDPLCGLYSLRLCHPADAVLSLGLRCTKCRVFLFSHRPLVAKDVK